MQVSIWVPVAVAVIAAVPVTIGVLIGRRTSEEANELRHAEVAISGLTALIAEIQEERSHCWEQLRECRRVLNEETRYRKDDR